MNDDSSVQTVLSPGNVDVVKVGAYQASEQPGCSCSGLVATEGVLDLMMKCLEIAFFQGTTQQIRTRCEGQGVLTLRVVTP